MQRRQTTSDGFTLLELLVAITIFSLVVGMSMFSLRYSFGVFRHMDAPFAEETRRITGLRDCIASTFVYIGERSDMYYNRNKEFYTYFNGERDSMTFISTKPMTMSGPALCRLFMRGRAIILEEAPLYANDSNYLEPSFETKERHELIIFSQVTDLRLEYFQGDKKLGTIKESLPTLIKISVIDDDNQQEIFCRVQADFNGKKLLVKALHDPI